MQIISSGDNEHEISNPGPKVIKLFSCSTQLSMKISLLINMKMPTKVGIFILIAENFLRSAIFSKDKFAIINNMGIILAGQISCSAELSMKKVL